MTSKLLFLLQFSLADPHIVRKGRFKRSEIVIKPLFWTIELHFVRNFGRSTNISCERVERQRRREREKGARNGRERERIEEDVKVIRRVRESVKMRRCERRCKESRCQGEQM